MADLPEHDLPGVLAEIAELAGLAAALAVARERGGTEAYIPQPANLGPEHWLVKAVGAEAARLIAERMGGGHVAIPLGPTSSRARIWATIRLGLAEGKSGPTVARLAGVDYRTVRRHRNGHSGNGAVESDQLDLLSPPLPRR